MTEIEKKIKELRQILRYHSDRYYNDDAPEIEDYEYDMMMRDLKNLEEKYPEYDTPDSPTKKVGGKADNSFESVEHSVRMESLQDAFSNRNYFCRTQCIFDQKCRIFIPVNNINLFTTQFLYYRIDSRTVHSHACSDRIYIWIIGPYCHLCTGTCLT